VNIATLRYDKLEDLSPTSSLFTKDDLLKNGFATVNLFHGPSGCGKTTAARILAADILLLKGRERDNLIKNGTIASNQYQEINCSTNNKVDHARDLEKTISDSLIGTIGNETYVYVLDEAQRFTTDAQEALLKVLEQVGAQENPPKVYIFVLSTHPEKFIDTFTRRMNPYEFTSLDLERSKRFMDEISSLIKKEPLDLRIKIRIFEASHGSPGKIMNLMQSYYVSGALPYNPDEDYSSAGKVYNAFKKCSVECLKTGETNIAPLLNSLEDLKNRLSSWETVRVYVMSYIIHLVDKEKTKPVTSLNSITLFSKYLEYLSKPLIDNVHGKADLLGRLLFLIKFRVETVKNTKDSSTDE
jgi:DNA polymerase III delta prime subunit